MPKLLSSLSISSATSSKFKGSHFLSSPPFYLVFLTSWDTLPLWLHASTINRSRNEPQTFSTTCIWYWRQDLRVQHCWSFLLHTELFYLLSVFCDCESSMMEKFLQRTIPPNQRQPYLLFLMQINSNRTFPGFFWRNLMFCFLYHEWEQCVDNLLQDCMLFTSIVKGDLC